ncbi:N-alpha-acetyltransferase 38, NatC auxiliary subunit-like [Toxorhynchites rutilus septentrionalis]|uniref:N-alpha-acetyltransferase 38, NatC auxiliary subunit-like n=1 Tax=Toxorhynchites rutilus septentrionalis TaxID=329112 RepID=UPI0024786B6C|nr:N-alpha-acetyltransferase 38, NatC auxiliary subunit-like [Toxorhynchites rutilus septentrionalis]
MSSGEKNSSDRRWKIINQEIESSKSSKSSVENEPDPSRRKLKSWLNKSFRIKITDGRILIGKFVCTDADANVILDMTSEFTPNGGDERGLGPVLIPGRYIVSIEIDVAKRVNNRSCL